MLQLVSHKDQYDVLRIQNCITAVATVVAYSFVMIGTFRYDRWVYFRIHHHKVNSITNKSSNSPNNNKWQTVHIILRLDRKESRLLLIQHCLRFTNCVACLQWMSLTLQINNQKCGWVLVLLWKVGIVVVEVEFWGHLLFGIKVSNISFLEAPIKLSTYISLKQVLEFPQLSLTSPSTKNCCSRIWDFN